MRKRAEKPPNLAVERTAGSHLLARGRSPRTLGVYEG